MDGVIFQGEIYLEHWRMSFGNVVIVNWAMTLFLLVFMNAMALLLGWRRAFGLVTWRFIKFVATLFGSVGVVVFLSNFEMAVRQSTVGASEQRRTLEFIETKSKILQQIALSCEDQRSELCGLAITANGTINFTYIRDRREFHMVGPMPIDLAGRRFMEDLGWRIRMMNESAVFVSEMDPVLSDDNRLTLLFFGQFLIILALAGSVGEATYQWRDAKAKS